MAIAIVIGGAIPAFAQESSPKHRDFNLESGRNIVDDDRLTTSIMVLIFEFLYSPSERIGGPIGIYDCVGKKDGAWCGWGMEDGSSFACADRYQCLDEVCTPMGSFEGGPCTSIEACWFGLCGDDGYCYPVADQEGEACWRKDDCFEGICNAGECVPEPVNEGGACEHEEATVCDAPRCNAGECVLESVCDVGEVCTDWHVEYYGPPNTQHFCYDVGKP